MERIAIMPRIKSIMKERKISVAELARGLNMHPASAAGMMKRETLQVQKLAELSVFFQYNFFREIAATLPFSEPDFSADNREVLDLQDRIKALEEEVKGLELEVGILRQTIRDLAGR
ncbi:helix-turn-helix domain-containing protein [Sunxiuqinia dokdonensis]|nr:helix-turn-helix domain-containing protein [Sunxiuqinia dokdonensis]